MRRNGIGSGKTYPERGKNDSIAAWMAKARARVPPTQPSVDPRCRNGWIANR
jgi:hypothetical protein